MFLEAGGVIQIFDLRINMHFQNIFVHVVGHERGGVIAKRWISEGIIWEDGRWLKLAQGCVQWLTFAIGVT